MAFTTFQGPDFSFISLAPDQGPLGEQLTAWVRRASAAGRVPCVYLRASWCGANVKLERSLDDPRMQRALRDVEVATLDVDAWVDALTPAGLSARSVPVFFILDADGRPTGASINGGSWRDDVPENMAPPLAEFFDRARATRPAAPEPAAPVYAPPAASAASAASSASSPPRSRFLAVALVIGSLALIGLAAWLKVSQDDAKRREDTNERIRQEVQESVQKSLRESLNKKQ